MSKFISITTRVSRRIAVAAACTLLFFSGCSSSTSEADAAADALDAYEEEQAELEEEAADLTADWELVTIPDIGTMRIPPSMEVQSEEYRAMKEELTGTSSDTFIVQQHGLNEDLPEAQDTYARIMVSCTQGNPGDYREADFDPANFSESDVDELDVYFERETRTQLANGGIEIIDWYPLEFLRLNGTTCLHMSYSRAGEDSETTRVNVYAFPRNDRLVRVTISYRASEAGMWSDDLELALSTLEFE